MKFSLNYSAIVAAAAVHFHFTTSFTVNAFAQSSHLPKVTRISKLGSAAVIEEVDEAIIDAPSLGSVEQQQVKNDDRNKLLPPTPGIQENSLFKCDDNVEYWSNFQLNGQWSAQDNLAEMANISRRFTASGDADKIAYWLKHVGRSGYFFTNAALGSIASGLHERFIANNNDDNVENKNGILPFNMNSSIATRLLLEAFICYEQDYEKINDGTYKQPWDMEVGNRQSSPINVITSTSRFVNEAIGTLARRNRQTEKDRSIWITNDASPNLYPKYYQTAFHYQTDGWMSQRSANVYETSTETLFLGRQDAMQRSALGPIIDYSKTFQMKSSSNDGEPLKVLEVACGTGRFMTFIRDGLPLDTECTAVDLSPFYLDKARDNDAYYRKEACRKQNLDRDTIQPLRLVQANAEELPFEDESFDVVVCVYLYHELPREARANVSAEMSRVLKKGGLLSFADSIQRGDRPALDAYIGNFEKMNEPYYVDYTEDDLPGQFMKEGLKPMDKSVRSTTKSLSFIKE